MSLFSLLLEIHAQAVLETEPTYISVPDGLVSPNVQDVMQDSYGLIWIATTNGLQKYDGYRFETFKNAATKPNSLCSNLFVDLQKRLWATTQNIEASLLMNQ